MSQGRASRPDDGQMEEARIESSRLTQAANDLILPGSQSEWFQMGGFGAILIVLAKSLCHNHGGVPHHLSSAEGHPLHGGLVVCGAARPPGTHCI